MLFPSFQGKRFSPYDVGPPHIPSILPSLPIARAYLSARLPACLPAHSSLSLSSYDFPAKRNGLGRSALTDRRESRNDESLSSTVAESSGTNERTRTPHAHYAYLLRILPCASFRRRAAIIYLPLYCAFIRVVTRVGIQSRRKLPRRKEGSKEQRPRFVVVVQKGREGERKREKNQIAG